MTEGLVTIAVAGDGAEADSILRTLAGAGITARLEGAEGELGGSPHDGPCRVLVESDLVGAAQAALLDEDEARRPRLLTRTTAPPPAIFDRMAERYDELRASEAQLGEQFDFTVAEGLGAATRLLDVGCGTGSLIAAAVERLGVKAWGVDASEAMLAKARERGVRGAAFKLAQADDLPFRKGWFDAVTMRLVVHTLGDRRSARAGGGAPRARARGPALHLDVRPGPLHRTPPAAVPPGSHGGRPRALPVRRGARRASWRRPGSATCACAGSSRAARSPASAPREQLRARHLSTIHLLPPEQVAAAAERLERRGRGGRAAARDGAALAATCRACLDRTSDGAGDGLSVGPSAAWKRSSVSCGSERASRTEPPPASCAQSKTSSPR